MRSDGDPTFLLLGGSFRLDCVGEKDFPAHFIWNFTKSHMICIRIFSMGGVWSSVFICVCLGRRRSCLEKFLSQCLLCLDLLWKFGLVHARPRGALLWIPDQLAGPLVGTWIHSYLDIKRNEIHSLSNLLFLLPWGVDLCGWIDHYGSGQYTVALSRDATTHIWCLDLQSHQFVGSSGFV